MKGRKTVLYIIFLVVLLLPLLQKVTHLIPEKPLAGTFVPHEKPVLTAKTWFDGSFQSDYDQYINENLGFHNSLVRLYNRFCYKLFHKINAANVVLGEEGYLFEQDYIDAYYGTDYLGLDSILYYVKKTRCLQDSLAARGKTLVVFLAPSKADFFPEFIPESQDKLAKPDSTNYQQFAKLLKEYGVNVIDYNAYYQTIKSKAKYPLYPKYGIHWSQYGMLQATDSLTRYIAQKSGYALPQIVIDAYNTSLDPQFSDCDLGDLLNISTKPLRSDTLCYPSWHWSTDTSSKPTLTVIADSFYWQIFNIGYQVNCFQGSFWYYNSSVYPECYTKETLTTDLDMREEIERSDVILIMSTTPGLKDFSWGAVEKLLKAL